MSSNKPPAKRGLLSLFLSLFLKLLLLVVVGASLYYAYQNLSADQLSTLHGLLDSVVVPVKGMLNNAAAYLGISGGSVPEIDGK